MTAAPARPKRILAIASGGGHWIQLYRMRPSWDGHRVTYVTTTPGLADDLARDADTREQARPGYAVVPEANRWQKVKLALLVLRIAALVIRQRPHFVITTGAAHGYFAIRIGKLLGAKTIWIDSIANADELSMSGNLVRPYADLWLTQWQHLAKPGQGPAFHGAVL